MLGNTLIVQVRDDTVEMTSFEIWNFSSGVIFILVFIFKHIPMVDARANTGQMRLASYMTLLYYLERENI